jgi:hypothetical protein
VTVRLGTERAGALFSADRTYRYALWRQLEDGLFATQGGTALFVGLNPSTATHDKSDPTCTREIDFAQRWGYARYAKVNVFGWMSTDPLGLLKPSDPAGPDNLAAIAAEAKGAALIVVCWGDGKGGKVKSLIAHQAAVVQRTLAQAYEPVECNVRCFGVTQAGNPKHPLYLARVSELVAWRLAHG